ncbi:MAG: glutaredoxin domain-containing protein [Acidimicrobiia bacterium]
MSIAEQSAPATVEFYWRAGCGFCAALERQLDRLGVTLDKRDIWADESAAAFVRSVANGNETVPTVKVGPAAMVNPSAKEVLGMIAEHAPQLLPAEG